VDCDILRRWVARSRRNAHRIKARMIIEGLNIASITRR
jgi:hypothetical protein